MELTFAEQSAAFLHSLILGVFAGVLYGIFKILRMLFCRGRVSIFVADYMYMIVVSLCVFLFSVGYLKGYIRIYIWLGCAVGFSAYRLSLGRLLSALYIPAIEFIKEILQKIIGKFKKITKKLLKNAMEILYNIFNKINNHRASRSDKKISKRVLTDDEKRNVENKARKRRRKVRRSH